MSSAEGAPVDDGADGATTPDDVDPAVGGAEAGDASPGLIDRVKGAAKAAVPELNGENAARAYGAVSAVGIGAMGVATGGVGIVAAGAAAVGGGIATSTALNTGIDAYKGASLSPTEMVVKAVTPPKRKALAYGGLLAGGAVGGLPGAVVGMSVGHRAPKDVSDAKSYAGKIKQGWQNPDVDVEVDRDDTGVERANQQEIEEGQGRGQGESQGPDAQTADRQADRGGATATTVGTDVETGDEGEGEGLGSLFGGGSDDGENERQTAEADGETTEADEVDEDIERRQEQYRREQRIEEAWEREYGDQDVPEEEKEPTIDPDAGSLTEGANKKVKEEDLGEDPDSQTTDRDLT